MKCNTGIPIEKKEKVLLTNYNVIHFKEHKNIYNYYLP